jgi:hypothetical protein
MLMAPMRWYCGLDLVKKYRDKFSKWAGVQASPAAQHQNGIPSCIIKHPKNLMALFLRGKGNIAARFRPAQSHLKHFADFHLIKRQAHKNESHWAGLIGDINMAVWGHDGGHVSVVFLS